MGKRTLADTAYDSDENRIHCVQHHIEAFIPNRPNQLERVELDKETYRDRNKIERFFDCLKRHQRLATRYEKTVVSFLALWHIAAALDWLR